MPLRWMSRHSTGDAFGRLLARDSQWAAVFRNGFLTQYSTADGLIWDDCNVEAFWADSDGSIWIGNEGWAGPFPAGTTEDHRTRRNPILSGLELRNQSRLLRF